MNKIPGAIAVGVIVIFGAWYTLQGRNQTAEAVIRWGIRTDNATVTPQILTVLNKLWEQEGITVELIEFSSSDEVATALAANQIDVGTMGVTEVFPLIAAGVPVKLIAQMSLSTNQLFVRNDNSVSTFADLRGKKIGGGLGSSSHLATRLALEEQGLDPDKDIEFVEVKKTLYALALNQGKEVDAIMGGKQNSTAFEPGQTINLPAWESQGYSDRLQPKQSLVARTEFIETHPHQSKALLQAYYRSFALITADQDAVASQVSAYISEKNPALKISKGDVLEIYGYTVFRAQVIAKDIEDLAHQSYKAGLVDDDLTARRIIDDQFQTIFEQ